MRHRAKKNGVDFTFSDQDLVNMSNADKALFVFESAKQVPDFVEKAMNAGGHSIDPANPLAFTGGTAIQDPVTVKILFKADGTNTIVKPAPAKVRKTKKNGIPDKK